MSFKPPAPVKWFIVNVTEERGDFADSVEYLCISQYEDDDCDAICWLGESWDEDSQELHARYLYWPLASRSRMSF